MRFVLVALLMVIPTVDGLADTSRQEKAKYIIETENFRGQIIARRDELIKISINELKALSNNKLDEKKQDIIREELVGIYEEIIDDYISEVVDVYMENLTDEEIDAIYKFDRSPEGISIGNKLPGIDRKIFRIDRRYIKLISERAESRIGKRLSEKRKN